MAYDSSASPEIIIPIVGDTSSFQLSVERIKQGLSSIESSASGLGGDFAEVQSKAKSLLDTINGAKSQQNIFGVLPQAMQSQMAMLQNIMVDQMEQIKKKLGNVSGTDIGSQMAKDTIKGIKQAFGYLGANLDTIIGSSMSMNKVYSGIAQSSRKAFNQMLRDIQKDAARQGRSSYSSGLGPISDNVLADMFRKNQASKAGLDAFSKRFNLSQEAERNVLMSQIQLAIPSLHRGSYYKNAIAHSNNSIVKPDIINQATHYKDRLPDRFRNLPITPTNITNQERRANSRIYNERLTQDEYDKVIQAAQKYPSYREALISAGVGMYTKARGKAGAFVMPQNPISRYKLASSMGFLWRDEMIPSWEGAPQFMKPLNSTNARIQKDLAAKDNRAVNEGTSVMSMLQGVNVGVEPVFTTATPTKSIKGMRVVASDITVRPNQYQIPSIALSDFNKWQKTGETLPVDWKGSDYKGPQRGTSGYKMIGRSEFTDLLGMFGHNTFGNGSKTNNSQQGMIMIDLSNEIFDKDASGQLVFERDSQGISRPKANKATLDAITSMFSISDADRAAGKKFPTQRYGNSNYVPFGFHDGKIILAEEEAYAKKAEESIKALGVNIFDNFINPNEQFSSYEDLNKRLEARARLLTPGVPISELGGRMPSASKTAFVNLKPLTGHDGASFFMPGYIPGGDIQARAPGIKGVFQTVDYKRAIKDIYGENVESFYAPGINATNAIIDQYKNKGIGSFSQEDIAKYFVDIMKYDALMDASTAKSPIFNGKTSAEASQIFSVMQKIGGGPYAIKTAQQAFTNQSELSSQFAQNLQLSEQQLAENRHKWEKYMADLAQPQYAAKALFGGNTLLDQQIRQNPSLISVMPIARNRVQNAIDSARISQLNNKIYDRDNLAMGLALSDPFAQIRQLGKANGLAIKNPELANALTLTFDQQNGLNQIAFSKWVQGQISGGRFPNNLLEQFTMQNMSEYWNKGSKYSLNPYGVYVTPDTIKRMGGGDVDGDTIQLMRKSLSEIVKTTYATRNAQLDGYTSPDLKTTVEGWVNRGIIPQDFADNIYRQNASAFQMGAVNNITAALSQGNWNDPAFVRKYGRGGIDARAMYDIDSTFAKSGVLARWTEYAANASSLGKPFASLFKDLLGASDTGDMTKLGDFSKVNFPSAYNGLTANMLMSLRDAPIAVDALKDLISYQDDLQNVNIDMQSGDPLKKARAEFLHKANDIQSQLITGAAQIISTSSIESMQSLLGTWGTQLNSESSDPRTSDERKAYIEQSRKEYNAQVAKLNHLTTFGLTEDRWNNDIGFATKTMMRDAYLTDDNTSAYAAARNAVISEERQKAIARNLNAAIAAGGNPDVIDAMQNNKAMEILAAQRQADERTYSFSMLNEIDKDPAGFYKHRILGDWSDKKDTQDTALGTAVHAVFESWGKRRIANDTDYGTAQEFTKLLNDKLLENPELFSELPTSGSKIYSKYQNALAFVANLPNLFRDEKVLGVQVPVNPYFGNKILNPNEPVSSIGYIDLVTQNKQGQVVNTDLKTYSNIGKDVNHQLNVYGSTNGANLKRVVSYNATDYSNPALFSTTAPLKEEDIAATMDIYKDKLQRIQAFASTGNAWNMLPLYTATDLSNSILRNPQSVVERTAGVRADFSERANAPIVKYANPDVNAEHELPMRYKEQQALINSKTGKGIAYGIALQQDISAYTKEMIDLGNMLQSKENRQQKGGKLTNPWLGYRNQIDSTYLLKRGEFMNRGASENELLDLENAKIRAEQSYDGALRASAVGDLKEFNEALTKQITQGGANSAAKSYANEFDSLTASIEKAKLAYQQLKDELNKKKNGENDPDLQAAQAQLAKAEELKKQRQTQIREAAMKDFSRQVIGLEDMQSGRATSISGRIDAQVDAFKDSIEKSRANITANIGKSITQEEANAYFKRLDTLDPQEYRKTIVDQYYKQQDKQIGSLVKQEARIGKHRGSMYGMSMITRQMYANENELDQRRALEEQQEQIRDSLVSQKNQMKNEGKIDTPEYKKISADLDRLTASLKRNRDEMDKLKGPAGTAKAVMISLGTTLSRVATQFSRKLFSKALQQAKRFVVQFDSQMAEIQTITMKSDEQMQPIRQQTISKAIGLRTSVSNVASVESSLYRQGLSDAQVSERTDKIIKFAAVSGAKIDVAMKGLTTAIQTGLVSSIDEAMDALVALGDSAATTAAQIEKGMQKAAASAKVVGVSYKQLTSLLAVATSNTQLSGTQMGTALNTMFTRYRKVTTQDYYKDINGESIGLNEVEKALNAVGIQLRQSDGQSFRGYVDVIRDIAKAWQELSDVQKSVVTNAMAGTRGANVFSAIVGDVDSLQKYLDLVQNSDGITQSKYDIMSKSLKASLETLKSAFDGFVESVVSNGTIQGIVNAITSVVTSLTDLSNNAGGIGTGIIAIAAALAYLAASAVPVVGPLLGIAAAGLTIAGGTALVNGIMGNPSAQKRTQQQQRQTKIKYDNLYFEQVSKSVNDVQSLIGQLNKYTTTTDKSVFSTQKFKSTINELSRIFPQASDAIDGNIDSVQKLQSYLESVNKQYGTYLENVRQQVVLRTINQNAQDVVTQLTDYAESLNIDYGTLGDENAPGRANAIYVIDTPSQLIPMYGSVNKGTIQLLTNSGILPKQLSDSITQVSNKYASTNDDITLDGIIKIAELLDTPQSQVQPFFDSFVDGSKYSGYSVGNYFNQQLAKALISRPWIINPGVSDQTRAFSVFAAANPESDAWVTSNSWIKIRTDKSDWLPQQLRQKYMEYWFADQGTTLEQFINDISNYWSKPEDERKKLFDLAVAAHKRVEDYNNQLQNVSAYNYAQLTSKFEQDVGGLFNTSGFVSPDYSSEDVTRLILNNLKSGNSNIFQGGKWGYTDESGFHMLNSENVETVIAQIMNVAPSAYPNVGDLSGIGLSNYYDSLMDLSDFETQLVLTDDADEIKNAANFFAGEHGKVLYDQDTNTLYATKKLMEQFGKANRIDYRNRATTVPVDGEEGILVYPTFDAETDSLYLQASSDSKDRTQQRRALVSAIAGADTWNNMTNAIDNMQGSQKLQSDSEWVYLRNLHNLRSNNQQPILSDQQMKTLITAYGNEKYDQSYFDVWNGKLFDTEGNILSFASQFATQQAYKYDRQRVKQHYGQNVWNEIISGGSLSAGAKEQMAFADATAFIQQNYANDPYASAAQNRLQTIFTGTQQEFDKYRQEINSKADDIVKARAALSRYINGTTRQGDIELLKRFYNGDIAGHTDDVRANINNAQAQLLGQTKIINAALSRTTNFASFNANGEVGLVSAKTARGQAYQRWFTAGNNILLDGNASANGYVRLKESTQPTVTETINNKASDLKANDNKSVYAIIAANGFTGLDADQTAKVNKLIEQDQMLTFLKHIDPTEEAAKAYSDRMSKGISGTFEQNNGLILGKLFGSDWKNGTLDWDNMQANYSILAADDLDKQYMDWVLQNMEGGQQLKQLLASEKLAMADQRTKNRIRKSILKLNYTSDLQSEGVYNAQQIADFASTMQAGTSSQKLAFISNVGKQVEDYSRMTWLFNKGQKMTSQEYGQLAAALNMDQKQLEQMMSTPAGKNAISNSIQQIQGDYLQTLADEVKTGLGINASDYAGNTEGYIDRLREAGQYSLANIFEQMGIAISKGGKIIFSDIKGNSGFKSAKDAFDSTLKDLNDSGSQRYLVAMMDAFNNRGLQRKVSTTPYSDLGVRPEPSDAELFAAQWDATYKNELDLKAFLSKNPMLAYAYDDWKAGRIESDDFYAQLQRTYLGANYTNSYAYNAGLISKSHLNLTNADALMTSYRDAMKTQNGAASMQALRTWLPQLDTFVSQYNSANDTQKTVLFNQVVQAIGSKQLQDIMFGSDYLEKTIEYYSLMQQGKTDSTKLTKMRSSIQGDLNQAQRMKYLYNQGTSMTSSQIQELASYLQIDPKVLSDSMKTTEGKAQINAILKKKADNIKTSFMEALQISFPDYTFDDVAGLAGQLRTAGNGALADIIEALGKAISAAGQIAANPGFTPAADALTQAATDYEKQNRNQRYINALRNAFKHRNDVLGEEYPKDQKQIGMAGYYNANYSDLDLTPFLQQNPLLAVLWSRTQKGSPKDILIAERQLKSYLDEMYYGVIDTDGYEYNKRVLNQAGIRFTDGASLLADYEKVLDSNDQYRIDAVQTAIDKIPGMRTFINEAFNANGSTDAIQEAYNRLQWNMGAQSLKQTYEHSPLLDNIMNQYEALQKVENGTSTWDEYASTIDTTKRQAERMQAILTGYDSASLEDKGQLAQYLGVNETYLASRMETSQGRTQIQQALSKKFNDYLSALGKAALNLPGIDASSIGGDVGKLTKALTDAGYAKLAELFNSLGDILQGVDLSGDDGYKSASQAFTDAKNEYAANNKNQTVLNAMADAMNKVNQARSVSSTTDQGLYAQAFGRYLDTAYNDVNFDSYLKTDPLLALAYDQLKNENGKVTIDQFGQMITDRQLGITRTDSYDYNKQLFDALGFDLSGEDKVSDMLETYTEIKTNGTDYQKEALDQLIQAFPQMSQVIQLATDGSDQADEALTKLSETMGGKAVQSANKYSKNLNDISAGYAAMRKGGKDATQAMGQLTQKQAALNNLVWARNRYAAGDRSDKVLDTLASQTGFDKQQMKAAKQGSDAANAYMQGFDSAITDNETALRDSADGMLAAVNEAIEAQNVDLSGLGVGELDSSAIAGLAQQLGGDAQMLLNLIASLDGLGIQVVSDGNGGFMLKSRTSTTSLGNKFSGSSGGGGGKSKAQKLIEDQKRQNQLYEHMIKMVQYEQTKYKNASQLGNYGKMLQEQIKLEKQHIPVLQRQKEQLLKQLAATKKGSDDWYTLRDAILETQENIEQMNKLIQQNTIALEQNEQQILKLKTTLQDYVLQQIQARQQLQRDMLAGRVSLEDNILKAIQQRYQDEWQLIKKDIEKKKQALEQEKNMIDERLRKRKQAQDEAAKYEQLAKLKEQLAFIELDPTRTKDAAELRKKITDLQKQIAWDIADSQAQAQKKLLDEQINGYDEYTTQQEEALQAFLEDANNFADELNQIMKMSQDELVEWLMENDKQYLLSTKDVQKQFVQGWIDTYKQAFGIVDTYWKQIEQILSSKERFMDYMMQSVTYVNASSEQQEQMRYEWGKAYDDWFATLDLSAIFDHLDDFLSGIGTSGSGNTVTKPTTTDQKIGSAIGEAYQKMLAESMSIASKQQNHAIWSVEYYISNAIAELIDKVPHNANGGIVDYTGLAWVDGTPSKPQAFLSAADTSLLRSFLDTSKMINVKPFLTNVDAKTTTGNSVSLGDVHISITQAQFSNDSDYEEVARRVGDAFTKELSKQGLNIASYSF